MNRDDIWAIVVHTLLGLLGGFVRELNATDKAWNVRKFIGGVLVSGFTGMVVFFICRSYNVEMWLTATLASMSGYAGTTALDFIIDMIKTSVSKSVNKDKSDEGKKE